MAYTAKKHNVIKQLYSNGGKKKDRTKSEVLGTYKSIL